MLEIRRGMFYHLLSLQNIKQYSVMPTINQVMYARYKKTKKASSLHSRSYLMGKYRQKAQKGHRCQLEFCTDTVVVQQPEG